MNIESKGPLRAKVERRDPVEARRQLEASILQQGGIKVGDVVVLPEVIRSIAVGGEVETRRAMIGHGHSAQARLEAAATDDILQTPDAYVEITASTDPQLQDRRFKIDLSDAPTQLHDAVLSRWEKMEKNEALYKDNPKDMPQDLKAEYDATRQRYAEMVPAIRETDAKIVEFPANSRVPYNPPSMNRLPASDRDIFASYRLKGWKNLGGNQREHYRELKARLEDTSLADAAK
ncbi:MAG: hypothetical protein HY565_00565 [Candidatus Kerfeldbacteria bacterium]|nr:hypothetical protein [Candidatus Kerfeldbacteria bacterium]